MRRNSPIRHPLQFGIHAGPQTLQRAWFDGLATRRPLPGDHASGLLRLGDWVRSLYSAIRHAMDYVRQSSFMVVPASDWLLYHYRRSSLHRAARLFGEAVIRQLLLDDEERLLYKALNLPLLACCDLLRRLRSIWPPGLLPVGPFLAF